MNVIVKYHFGGVYKAMVARITKKWIVVICNDVSTMNFDRETGYVAGAFRGRGNLTPSRIDPTSLAECENLAMNNGGTWDSGWKPKRQKIAIGEA